MIGLSGIKPSQGGRKKSKRRGRGNGSGKWTYCGRWMNGQNCRSGGGVPDWFEWGQTPLFRRMPKLKGFTNARFKKEYSIVNVKEIALLAEKGITTIDKWVLLEQKIIRKKTLPVKVLWDGEISIKVDIKVDSISKKARTSIEAAWGKVGI